MLLISKNIFSDFEGKPDDGLEVSLQTQSHQSYFGMT